MTKLIQIELSGEDMFGLDDQGRIWIRYYTADRGAYWELFDDGLLEEEEEK